MIIWVITEPRVRLASGCDQWLVMHPTNDSILAYADTEVEAKQAASLLTWALTDARSELREQSEDP